MICRLVLFYLFWLNIPLIINILILIMNKQLLIFLNDLTKLFAGVIFDIIIRLKSYKWDLFYFFRVIHPFGVGFDCCLCTWLLLITLRIWIWIGVGFLFEILTASFPNNYSIAILARVRAITFSLLLIFEISVDLGLILLRLDDNWWAKQGCTHIVLVINMVEVGIFEGTQ